MAGLALEDGWFGENKQTKKNRSGKEEKKTNLLAENGAAALLCSIEAELGHQWQICGKTGGAELIRSDLCRPGRSSAGQAELGQCSAGPDDPTGDGRRSGGGGRSSFCLESDGSDLFWRRYCSATVTREKEKKRPENPSSDTK